MNEIERQKKVIDMMITSHSVLKDRYSRASSLFEVSLLVASIILNALIFVDSKFITKFTGANDDQQKLITGIATLIIFTISVVLLQVNWKEKSSSHGIAADQLFELKQECKTIISLPAEQDKLLIINEFNKKYTQITGMLIKIPDRKFNSLKLIHAKKVELSKLIDRYPGSFLWILKLKLFVSSFKSKNNTYGHI